MNIKFPIPDLKLGTSKRRASPKPIAAIHIGRTDIHFLVAQKRGNSIRFLASGDLSRDADLEPLQQLADYFKKQKINCHHVLLTLSRSELELTTIALPPAEENEISAIVAVEVEQQVGDVDGSPIADYLISRRDGSRPSEALAFSISQKQLNLWLSRAKQSKLTLVGIVPRHLAAVSVLRKQGILKTSLSVVMSIYSGEAELVVCRSGAPLFLRTLRITADDPSMLAEQLGLEIQRSVALASADATSDAPDLFLVDGTNDYQPLLDALLERRFGPIQKVDPLGAWENTESDGSITHTSCETPLAGALTDYFDEVLAIDLLHPKKPAPPPNPWRGRILIGGVAAAALVTVGYVLRSDVEDLQLQVADKQATYDERSKMANKLEEKADEVRWVERWMEDQVHWLDELQTLSSQLPAGQFATIRRLTANAQDQNGLIDLSVQVSEPERVAELENSLRTARFTVTSKRVSEQGAAEEYPWQFETRVAFPINVEKQYDYIEPTKTAENSSDPNKAPAVNAPAASPSEPASAESPASTASPVSSENKAQPSGDTSAKESGASS